MEFEYLINDEKIKCYPKNLTELRGVKSYLTRYVDGFRFDPLFKLKLWDGKNTKYNKENNTFPLGLWKEAVKCCEEFGYNYSFKNGNEFPLNREVKKKEFVEFITDFFSEFKYQPRDYQINAAWEVIKNRYCNISVATSGGKTLIYSMVYFFLIHKYPDKKFLLIVPSKTLVTQFYDEIQEFNYRGQIKFNAQEIFGKEEKPRTMDPLSEPNLVISTFQSLAYEDKIEPTIDQKKSVRIGANGKPRKEKAKVVSKLRYEPSWYKQFWSVTVDECLHPETLITMYDNTKKQIKDVKSGDLVKTVNEKTMEIEIKPVIKQHINLNKGQQMYEIEMEDGSVIKITGNHEIKLTNGTWIKAEELKGNEDILYIK